VIILGGFFFLSVIDIKVGDEFGGCWGENFGGGGFCNGKYQNGKFAKNP